MPEKEAAGRQAAENQATVNPATVKQATGKRAAAKTATGAAEGESGGGFTAEERAAMKGRAAELRTEARRGGRTAKADGAADVLAAIAAMPEADRVLAEGVHAIVTEIAPQLAPRTWYGMPAYAKDGKVLCFFQGAEKFKTRYATFAFNDVAAIDDGAMWPTAYALTQLGTQEAAAIRDLVARAVA